MAHVGIEMQQAGDKAGLRALSALPISFVGLGVFRAWMGVLGNVLFVSRGAEQLFDCLLAAILLSAVAFAAKLVPLCANRCAHALCLAGSLASSVAGAIGTLLLSGTAQTVCLWIALAACAIAAALFILFWCELLSCLDITRVALCLALVYLAEQVLLFFLEDLPTAKLAAASLVLPLVSQLMLVRAFSYIPADSRPRVISGKQRIPWKIVGIFALYSFVTGVRRAVFTGASSSQAAVLASLLVAGFLLVAIIVFPKQFDLTIMYRTPVFLLFCALLLIPLLGPFDRGWLPFFLAVSARLFEVVVFLLLCDISKSMGIMALVVFGIEEATVAFSSLGYALGVQAQRMSAPFASETTLVLVGIASLIVVTLLLFNDHKLADDWGITLFGPGKMEWNVDRRRSLAEQCDRVEREFGLTAREREVLFLLGEGKSLAMVCEELVIAKGTAKAHTDHIYRKLGISTRRELLDLLGKTKETKK